MDDDGALEIRHSFYSQQSPQYLSPADDRGCKSDIVTMRSQLNMSPNSGIHRDHIPHSVKGHGQYYMKYEHDEVPVKDSPSYTLSQQREKESLTNTELDKLEVKILRNMSQELLTDYSSGTSLESNIKFFKTTVQGIFDNFYTSMRDFELYKKRFNDILAKNQKDAVADMEDFIKDMIQHIMSSDSSITTESRKSDTNSKKTDSTFDVTDGNTSNKASVCLSNSEERISATNLPEENNGQVDTASGSEILSPFVEAYRNKDYDPTESTLDANKTSKTKRVLKNEEVLNIYLLSGNPCVQIKMNDRNLLSEINIKKPSRDFDDGKYGASAENVRRLAAKRNELKKYVEQNHDDGPDRDIPVKVSYAKKNIHLNEDFALDREEKSFISKLCSYLCRKFHKS